MILAFLGMLLSDTNQYLVLITDFMRIVITAAANILIWPYVYGFSMNYYKALKAEKKLK